MDTFLSSFSSFSVDNIAAAKSFYAGLLNLELTDESMGLQFSLPGGGSLFMYEKPDHQPASFTVLNFIVEDINTVIDLYTEKDIHFERYDNLPAEQDERGVLRGKAAGQGPDIAWFKDPAGNVLALIES